MPTLRELVAARHEHVRLHGPYPFADMSFAELASGAEAMGMQNWADALRGTRAAERPGAARACADACETMNRPGADAAGILKLGSWPEFACLPDALRAWADTAEENAKGRDQARGRDKPTRRVYFGLRVEDDL